MSVSMLEELFEPEDARALSITAFIAHGRLVVAINDRLGIRCRLIVPLDADAAVVIETRGVSPKGRKPDSGPREGG